MLSRLLSILGILVSVSCVWAATTLYPGGYDWNRNFISTLIRGPAGSARTLADVGVLFFCVSIAFVFERLARAVEFAKVSKIVRIAGIGSMVYTAFIITPMHDLMVTISVAFTLVAAIALIWALLSKREMGFFVFGCLCLVVLVVSATMYYMGHLYPLLPWAQRATYSLFAIWLVSMDLVFRRERLRQMELA